MCPRMDTVSEKQGSGAMSTQATGMAFSYSILSSECSRMPVNRTTCVWSKSGKSVFCIEKSQMKAEYLFNFFVLFNFDSILQMCAHSKKCLHKHRFYHSTQSSDLIVMLVSYKLFLIQRIEGPTSIQNVKINASARIIII